MAHEAVIEHHRRRVVRVALTLAAAAAALLVVAPNPAGAEEAATPVAPVAVALVEPADGHHYDHLERAPMLQFDPGKDENGKHLQPKWILLASDAAMTKTVRYCRQFVWAMSAGAYHWGCNRWATGVDQAGNDTLLALEPGVYYWQVVSKSNVKDAADIVSGVRSFAIDEEPKEASIGEISEQVHGTAFDDGTFLNLGAAAYVNSKVRVKTISSSRLAPYAFRISASHLGQVDASRSYIKLSSAAGTRYLKVAKYGTNSVRAVWRLSTAERRLKTKRFTYQAYVKSTKNGAMVKSQARVVLIKPPAKKPAINYD